MMPLKIPSLMLLLLFTTSLPANADLVVEFGDAQADIASGVGTASTSFDVVIRNNMSDTINLAGFTLLLDIEPISNVTPELPDGVSFGTPVVDYLLLAGATVTAPNPAAGDLGVNQFIIISTTLAPGESVTALTVNLEIDPAAALVGDYGLALNLAGENRIDFSTSGGATLNDIPTFLPGKLTITAVPEPSAMMFGATLVGLLGFDAQRKKLRAYLRKRQA
jgi:hypothetical protein